MNPSNFGAAVKGALTSLTVWAGAAFLAIGNIAPYVTPQLLQGLGFTPKAAGVTFNAVGALMIILRAMTTKSLTDKGNAPASTPTPPPAALWAALALVPLLSLIGCATTGGASPSFESIVATAANADDIALKTIGNLAASRVLSSDQATAAVKVTDAIHAALNVAQVAYSAGDQTTAAAKIASATAALAQVQLCIATGAKLPIAQCLASVTSP